MPIINQFLPPFAETTRLRELDAKLTIGLSEKHSSIHAKNKHANDTNTVYTKGALDNLEQQLAAKGTLSIPIMSGFSVRIDGNDEPISVVAATEITSDTPNHGEMSSMLYLRDHIQTASVLMELYLNDPKRYEQEGKQGRVLLLSALHLMSTPAQLKRFKNIIEKGYASQEEWPHISLLFDDLEGNEANGWRNKQDTFQMLAYLACDALERGYIAVDDLNRSHKKFLGSVAPLLQAVGFPNYESSGSWEEIEARRTSVMAVETALLDKIALLARSDNHAFLTGGLGIKTITTMRDKGLQTIAARLPFESPDYPKNSIKYREADATLTYVLMYGIPKLLSDESLPIGPQKEIMNEHAIELLVLHELEGLIDPFTGCMRRYDGDSYQRVNFHTNEMQQIIGNIKHVVQQQAKNGEIDLDKKQSLRGELMPAGREAAWTHPLGQISAWAAKRSIAAYKSGQPDEGNRYQAISRRFLDHAIAAVTDEDDWHAVLDNKKQYVIQKAPAAKLPECYVTYQTPQGETFVVPSPHTPLNWSTAMLKEAVGLLRIATMLQ